MRTRLHPKTRLRQERLKRGWLPRDVANALGITERAYRYLESGERNPSWPTACKLESLFGVPARELLICVGPEDGVSIPLRHDSKNE